MTEAYLKLLGVFKSDEIYIDHKREEFVITHKSKRTRIKREDVEQRLSIIRNFVLIGRIDALEEFFNLSLDELND